MFEKILYTYVECNLTVVKKILEDSGWLKDSYYRNKGGIDMVLSPSLLSTSVLLVL